MLDVLILKYRNEITRLLRLWRWVESANGVLTLIWFFRFAFLMGLTASVVINQADFAHIRLPLTWALFFLYLYVIGTGVFGIYNSLWFQTRSVKFVQVVIEIALYSYFYYLFGDSDSNLGFLYILPLFVAVRFLGSDRAVLAFLFASVCLFGVLFNITGSTAHGGLWEPFLRQELFILFPTLLYAIKRRPSLLPTVVDEKSQLLSALKSYTDGVYVMDADHRLLFVNDVLKSRHGPFTLGQSCASYFSCRDDFCEGCPIMAPAPINSESEKRSGRFVDEDGHPYEVELSYFPLPSDNGVPSLGVVIAKNISQDKETERRLVEYSHAVETRVQSLISERALWIETFHDMGKHLTGRRDLREVMNFVVQVTQIRLNAETAALFLLEKDRLLRRSIAGVEEEWFPEESYLIGEGITGQAIQSLEGAKYANPIRVNGVHESPLVVAQHLTRYTEKLKTHQVKHLIAVPLNGQEKSFGVLRVVNRLDAKGELAADGFTQADEDFLVSIASMVAIALEDQNAKLLTEATQRLRETTTLYSVLDRMNQTLDLDELFQVIVEEAKGTIARADKAIIHRIDSRAGVLLPKTISNPAGVKSGLAPMRTNEGIAGRAISSKRVVNVPDTSLDPDYIPRQSNIASLMVVPLLVNARVIGTLSVGSRQTHAFTTDDQRLLGALAAQAAIAIDQAQLYARERTLRQVATLVTSTLEIDEVLHHLLDQLGQVVEYESTSIQLLAGDHFQVIACRGFDDDAAVRQISFPATDSKFPNERVMALREPHIVADVRVHYPHFIEEQDRFHSGHIRSWMGIPLLSKDSVIGMISIEMGIPEYYTAEDASVALAFASQVAIAIENARLFKKAQQQLAELEGLYQASKVLTSSHDIQDVLKSLVQLAGQVAGTGHPSIVLVGEDGTLIDSFEDREISLCLHQRARPNGVTRQVLEAGEPIIFDHVEDDGHTHNPLVLLEKYQSYAAFPIRAQGRIRAVLFVHSHKPAAFSGRADLLVTFCNQAAIAVENAAIYKEAEQQAEMRNRLASASQKLIQYTKLEDLFRSCTEMGAAIFDVEDCSLYLRNDERGTIDLVSSSGIPPSVWTKRQAPLAGPGLTAYVARTGETLNFGGEEYREHASWSGQAGEPFVEHLKHLPSGACHSLLIGPLVDSKGNRVGVLKLENRRGARAKKRFTSIEEALHKTFASQVGMAIERAKFHQLWLNEQIKQQAREYLDRELHDIVNNLHGTLVLGASNAARWLAAAEFDKVQRQLNVMWKASMHVHQELNQIRLDLRDPEQLAEGLMPALKRYADMLNLEGSFESDVTRALPRQTEEGLFKIGRAAIHNVQKHAGVNWLTARLEDCSEGLTLTISDRGVGFDVNAALRHGNAFGLDNMYWRARSIQADCIIDSYPGRGTQLRVTIPSLEEMNEPN